ncbi:uncharacterized protein LOC119995819 [Tripterygium wilfordii]|uniref:uncharacterized protein LOC119995819 n=1 Tax=Tripterygium wilfordii TaxID=458696 RepID=UPI0018F7F761|nr:uncharacterized protein LOC119995819 [Tripterygium wilfordii]
MPLEKAKWKEIDEAIKEKICDLTLKRFEVEDTPVIRKVIKSMANASYHNWRARLHQHYKIYKTIEERLANPPKNVSIQQWKTVMDYFGSDKFLKISQRNLENRKSHETPHVAGRKSFKSVSFDNRDMETGKKPNMQELWKLTHMRSNGSWVNDKAKQVDEDVSYLVNHFVEGESSNQLTSDEAFIEVVGEKSSANYGPKPIKTRVRIEAQLEKATQQRDEVIKDLKELEVRFEDQRVRQEDEISRMKTEMNAQKAEMDAQRAEMQSQLQIIMSQLHPNQAAS